jgi:hypothetical protein
MVRFHPVILVASFLVFAISCRSDKPVAAADSGKVPVADSGQGAPATPATPGSPDVAAPAPGPASPKAAGEVQIPATDRDKLTKCYQEVYCAQKKGEMDKLLGIYKKFGFETPQDFNKIWIDAAKDTDWVTKISHEVSKNCK